MPNCELRCVTSGSYSVRRPASRVRRLLACGVGYCRLRRGELLVLTPALVHHLLRAAEEELGDLGVALLKHAVACLGVDVILQGNLRVAGVQLERVLALTGARGVVAI